MNIFNIERTFQTKKERKWHTIYVAVDAHGTLIKPYHDKVEFYPDAVEVMRYFNSRSDFKVILWTSSHWQEVELLKIKAKMEGVYFDFVNENPLEKDSARACFDDKFYFNILLDDKAGFVGETDWTAIKNELIRIGEWKQPKLAKTTMKRRAVYVGQSPLGVQVWKNGRQPDAELTYGMTGTYIGDTFIPDDKDVPAITIAEKLLYFPSL